MLIDKLALQDGSVLGCLRNIRVHEGAQASLM
jgi:hypothetical protein